MLKYLNRTMSSDSTSPYKMVAAPGKKHYYETAPINIKVCEASTTMILEAIKSTNLKENEAFVICDYGAADGGTSVSVIREVIDFIKKKFGSSKEVHVIYEDLPSNNFNSLFDVITGDTSFLTEYNNVYVTACCTSFYQQCLPSETINLGLSYTAMHWLSEKPCDLSGGIIIDAGTDHTPTEKAMYARQAAKDWESNLLYRSNELKPGGSAFIVTLCTDERGYCVGMRPGVKESMFKFMSKLLKDMVTEGVITQDEFRKINFIIYFRTPSELEAPFKDINSAVRKAGLKLEKITIKVIDCPYLKSWNENKADNNFTAQEYAEGFVQDVQRWSRSTILFGLSEVRSNNEKNNVLEEFYTRYRMEIAKHPGNHCYDFISAYIHITKGV